MPGYTHFPWHAWDCSFMGFLDAETYYVSQTWSRSVSIPPPPADSEDERLAVLHAAKHRTKRELEIREQCLALQLQLWPVVATLKLRGVNKKNWAPFPLGTKPTLPKTWEMLRAALWDLQCGLYALKKDFNRGRPIHTLGSQIGNTTVLTPGHPSYPGGHAAQCHVAVLLLEAAITRISSKHVDLPPLLTHMLHSAERVAENRVIAGIHFPSDSDAGKQLALQYVPVLLRSELFDGLLTTAAQELERVWP